MDARDIVLFMDNYFDHNWDDIYRAISGKTHIKEFNDENVKLMCETKLYALICQGYKVVVITDSEYPKSILLYAKPPFVIYYKKDLDTVAQQFEKMYKTNKYKPEEGCFID